MGSACAYPNGASGATFTVNGAPSTVAVKARAFAQSEREFRDGDKVVLKLPMAVRLKEWLGGKAVTIHRGPLVYSLRVAEKRAESTTDTP